MSKKMISAIIAFTICIGVIPGLSINGVTLRAASITSTEVSSASNKVITVEKVNVDSTAKKITIEGNISDGIGRYVTLKVTNPEGEIDYIDQVVSNSNGSFIVEFRPKKWTAGKFEYQIGGDQVTNLSQGNFTIESSSEVSTPATSVILDKVEASVKEGQNVQLKETVDPASATNKAVKWSSSDQSVATVDQTGKVTGVKAGKATITVTTVDGSLKAECVVTVTSQSSGGSSSGSSSGNTTPAVIKPVITTPAVTTPAIATETTQNKEVTKVTISIINGTASKDGINIKLAVKPYVQQGRTMAGIRDVANILQIENKNIVWNNKNKEVIIKTKDKEIKLVLNQKYAMVNGKKIALDVPVQMKNGSTVLPIAQIARLLDANVQFDAKTKEVTFGIQK